MIRRQFLSVSAAYAASLRYTYGSVERGKVFRLAFVHPSRPTQNLGKQAGPPINAFFIELERLGLIEGHNLKIERYSALGSAERLAEIAHEAALSVPDVIVAVSGRTVLLLKKATRSIPIVGFMSDPILYGAAGSIAHPGGNVTGVIVDAGIETWQKRLEILKEAIPSIKRVFYVAPRTAWESSVGLAVQAVTQEMGLSLIGPPVESPHQEADYQKAFAETDGPDACLINSATENLVARKLLCNLMRDKKLLAMCPYREFVADGCGMSYDIDLTDLNRYAAHQVSEILDGTSPCNIPFYQPKAFKLIINLRAFEEVGVKLSSSILARADEII